MSEHVVEISRVARSLHSLHSLLELPFQHDQDLVYPRRAVRRQQCASNLDERHHLLSLTSDSPRSWLTDNLLVLSSTRRAVRPLWIDPDHALRAAACRRCTAGRVLERAASSALRVVDGR